MPYAVFRFRGGGDTALGDNFHFFTKLRCQFERLAKRRFALVAAVNISVIHCGNAKVEVRLDKTDPFPRRHIPVHQSPVAHHQA